MPELAIDKSKTAVLVMDFQNDIVGTSPMAAERGVLQKTQGVLSAARRVGIPVIYVVVRFRPGYPEVSPRNKSFTQMKQTGRMLEGTPGAEIHPAVTPQGGEAVVVKRRTNAFYNTDLASILNAGGIETLVLIGHSTSGVVLATGRYAADADYDLIFLEDCCADRVPEAHAFLMESFFPRIGTVASSEDFIGAIS